MNINTSINQKSKSKQCVSSIINRSMTNIQIMSNSSPKRVPGYPKHHLNKIILYTCLHCKTEAAPSHSNVFYNTIVICKVRSCGCNDSVIHHSVIICLHYEWASSFCGCRDNRTQIRQFLPQQNISSVKTINILSRIYNSTFLISVTTFVFNLH